MKLLFLIPPFVDITAPLLGLPSLAAYLKLKGFSDIHIKDLNIEFLEFLAESDYMEKQARLVREDFETLDRSENLERSQYKKYQNLVLLYGFCVKKGYQNLNYYTNFLRQEETFYNVSRYSSEVESFFHLCFQLVNYKSPASISFLFYTAVTDRIPEGEHVFSRFYGEKILPHIIRLKPDLVGFSVCYEVQFFHAMYLGKRRKENYPSMFVVVGGTHVNMLEREFQGGNIDLFSFVDAYVAGEGEIPMNALLETLQEGKDLSIVPGLFHRDNQNQVRATAPPATIPHGELPPPDFSRLPLDKYLSPKNVIPYRVSRGCYWSKCAFCSHFQTRAFSFKKARHVIEDIKKLMALYQTDFIYFVDDALPRAFLEKFVDLLIAEDIDVNWLGNVRPEKFLTEPLIAKMAQAGCKEIYIGIESASQRLLEVIRKGIDVNTVVRIVNDCHKHFISIKMNFIRGLPSERHEDISKTIRFIKKNAKNCDIICLTPLVVDLDTDLSENPAKYGIEIIDKRRPFSTALNFKRTAGILHDDQTKELYSKDENFFNRFHFFSRMHHFLYTVKFSRKEFEHLSSQYFLITDNLQNKQPREEQAGHLELTWKPYLKAHQFITLNFNVNATEKEFINDRLYAQKIYYIYSLHSFDYSHAFNEKGYQLLSLCNGENTIGNMMTILSSLHRAGEIPWDNHIQKILHHFFNTGLIDFHE